MTSLSILNFYDKLPTDLQIYINEFFENGVIPHHKIQMRKIFANHFERIFFNNRFNFRNEYEYFIYNYIRTEDADIYDTYENVIQYNERNHIIGSFNPINEDENTYEIENQFGTRDESEPPYGLSLTQNRLVYNEIDDEDCFKYLIVKYYKVLFLTDEELWSLFYIYFEPKKFFKNADEKILIEYFEFEANVKNDKRMNIIARGIREAVYKARDRLRIKENRYIDLLNRKKTIDIIKNKKEIDFYIEKIIWFAFCLSTEKNELITNIMFPNTSNTMLEFDGVENIYKTECRMINMKGTDLRVIIRKCNDRTFY